MLSILVVFDVHVCVCVCVWCLSYQGCVLTGTGSFSGFHPISLTISRSYYFKDKYPRTKVLVMAFIEAGCFAERYL